MVILGADPIFDCLCTVVGDDNLDITGGFIDDEHFEVDPRSQQNEILAKGDEVTQIELII